MLGAGSSGRPLAGQTVPHFRFDIDEFLSGEFLDVVPALADIEPGPDGSFPEGFAVLGATMLFEAFDTLHGGELWRTDGTPAGTTFVKDIFPGTNSANPFSFAVVGSVAILKAFSQTDDRELWRSDGTPGGTFALVDPTPFATTGSGPSDLTDSAGTLVFAADDGEAEVDSIQRVALQLEA